MKRVVPDLPVGCVASHFLDSGAFSHVGLSEKYREDNPGAGEWAYYDTPEYWAYLDAYAAFVKKYAVAIDLYANVDVIGNSELTWRNQKYLEKTHKLTPVPVVHCGSRLEVLQHYVERDYPVVGLGGLVGKTSKRGARDWIDRCFDYVCDTRDRLPRVKLHGFGVTNFNLLVRFPWYSVDSATWTKVGAVGGILAPRKRDKKFCFTVQPYIIKISHDSPGRKFKGQHLDSLSDSERKDVMEWIRECGVPMGKVGEDGEVLKEGVRTWHRYRKIVNLMFFERLRAALPPYPRPFRSELPKNLGLFED